MAEKFSKNLLQSQNVNNDKLTVDTSVLQGIPMASGTGLNWNLNISICFPIHS